MTKRGRGKNKGNKWERTFCRVMSKWWTHGKRDDIFWRSASSGGFATNRMLRNKKTSTQHGDIAAIDPIGAPLLQLMTIELKCGYPKISPFDLIYKAGDNMWLDWIAQVSRDAKQADAPYWMIAHHQDRKEPIVCVPSRFCTAHASWSPAITESGIFRFWHCKLDFTFMKLTTLLAFTSPESIMDLAATRNKELKDKMKRLKRRVKL